MLQFKKIVGKLLSSNMYLLFEEGVADCYLIDIGDSSALAEELPDGMNIKGVFLTHSHFDHIAGINVLCRMFPDCKVFTSEYGSEAIKSDKKNFSLYHQQSLVYEGDKITILKEGDTIQLFEDSILHIMETPGHCPSCLTYYTEDYVFTGDSYIPDVPIVTKLPKGNKVQANESKERILNISTNKIILAGHDKDKWVSIL